MISKALGKYSVGVGDRFGRAGVAQLGAIRRLYDDGVLATPVWNKSLREHRLTGTNPEGTRQAADAAVRESGWIHSYFVDADHVDPESLDSFLPHCDYFTIDVARYLGSPAAPDLRARFLATSAELIGTEEVPGATRRFEITRELADFAASQYLEALVQAQSAYRRIAERKEPGGFKIEVSMDETPRAQSSEELLLILRAASLLQLPLDAVAPRFTGRFLKGIDYLGDVRRFEDDFENHVAALRFAVTNFKMKTELKLSVHSGSDKFSLYPVMNCVLKRHDAGLHLKTAGTTWLEEIAALAESGGDELQLARDIYRTAYVERDTLVAPYAEVVAVDCARLPTPEVVQDWTGPELAAAVRHLPTDPRFNPDFRQLMHVAYPVAARFGRRFLDALENNQAQIGPRVTENLYERHLRPLFGK